MSLVIKFYLTSSMLSMFRTLIDSSSGNCDFSIVSIGRVFFVSMCVGVSVWLGWGGICVAGCFSLLHTFTSKLILDYLGTRPFSWICRHYSWYVRVTGYWLLHI